MENRIQHLFLILMAMMVIVLSPAFADDDAPVIDPGIEPEKFKVARIDDEFFEFGVFGGVISIQDFGTVPVYGGSAVFHATEDLFLQANVGYAKAGVAAFEEIIGEDIRLISDEERDFVYYDFMVGWNWLPGESFITRHLAFQSSNYISAGVGNTRFAGESNFTWVAGLGYKLVLTDFLAWQYELKDHIFYTELLGDPGLTHNLEATSGFSLFF